MAFPFEKLRGGHVFQLTEDQNEKIRFENTKTGYRVATSVEGIGTGEGGDRIVCDDPHKIGDIYSKAMREQVLQWWNEEMSTRGNNPSTVAKVVIMQRVHEDDLSGHVLTQGNYTHLCLPAEYEGSKGSTSIGWSDPRTTPSELLWPNRYPVEKVAEMKKSLGSRAFAVQYQQRPAPEEGEIIKRSWWKFYQIPPSDLDWIMISWDFTFKDSKNSDFVVGQVWGRKGANKYLLGQVRGKMTFTETIQAMFTLNAHWKNINENLVEEKANGAAIIDSLKDKIPGIVGWSPIESKESRAHAIAPQVEAGNIHLPDPSIAPWIHEYIEEWNFFPNGKNDDQVDATTQAIRRLSEKESWWIDAPNEYFDQPDETSPKDKLVNMFWAGSYH